MTLLLYIGVGILLMIVQTTLLPYFLFFDHLYDLLIPVLIHAAIFRSFGESLFLVIVFGALMDNLSASPAGFYLTFYIWVIIGVRYLKLFLHVGSLSLVTLVVMVAVALESLVLAGLASVNSLMISATVNSFGFVFTQVVWALLTAPFLLSGLNFLLMNLPILRTVFSSSRRDEIKGH